MADPWVSDTQQWLNDTYGSNSQFETVVVNGKTGWGTMYALTRALQIELGFTSLSDNFGPGAFAAVDAIAPINNSTSNKNIIRIIQGAMYCKGYDGGSGDLDGIYSATTINGVRELRSDMGLAPSTGEMTSKVLKALLTMDAYVLLDGGSTQVRAIQRALNSRYLTRDEFFVIPADGYYSRGVQSAVMYAIQYEIGMDDNTANGNFGPGTQSGLKTLGNVGLGDSDSSSGNFLVHLFQAVLTFNGFPVTFDGVFSSATSAAANSFQIFSALPVSGRADFQTWASLLVSTGDVNRPATAADTIRTITPDRAQTLVAHGYQTICRYLTNSPVPDPLDKNIKPGEIQDILNAGLKVVPVFQEGGDYLEYFSYSRGLYAGKKAHEAALSYGFKSTTVIYFAVDFDAVEDEVWSNVVPYFQGINRAISDAGGRYRVGVYGARNTCSIVSNEGLAVFSFVSDMSTGYSGNLGFRLPTNWAFDQILEYEIGAGDGWVNIDKNVASGRDLGQNSIDTPVAVPTPRSLEVELPVGTTFQEGLLDDVETELTRLMSSTQEEKALLTRRFAASHVLTHDAVITQLANDFKLRKAFVQTVLAWESACMNADDYNGDLAVIASYAWVLFAGEVAPIKTDSSTGVCQVYAATAIGAANWTKNQLGVLHDIPVRNIYVPMDMWMTWTALNLVPDDNLKFAALVLLEAAGAPYKANMPLDSDRELLMSPTPEQVTRTLAYYNGALPYGEKLVPLYNLFEWYNASARD